MIKINLEKINQPRVRKQYLVKENFRINYYGAYILSFISSISN